MVRTLFDPMPAWLVFAGTLLVFALASELGAVLGRRRRRRSEGEDLRSHAGIVLAALLALLGLLLAFGFSIVESRFLARKQLVLEEANAIGTTYLRAEMLPAPYRERAQALLRRYVRVRSPSSAAELRRTLIRSEELHRDLWAVADRTAGAKPDPITSLFVQSLNDVIDLHEERVTVALYQRLPGPILLTLYIVALLVMSILGYSVGLGRARARLPTLAVIVAIAIVLLLIVELDRPWQRAFEVNRQALDDVQETMSHDYEAGPRAPATDT